MQPDSLFVGQRSWQGDHILHRLANMQGRFGLEKHAGGTEVLRFSALGRLRTAADELERELEIDRTEELLARRQAIVAAIERLERLAAERALPDDLVQRVRTRHRERLKHFERAPERGEYHQDLTAPPDEIALLLLAAERERINELYSQGTLKDEARRRLERELDLREANIAGHQHEE